MRSDPISMQSPLAVDLAQGRRRNMSTRPAPRRRPRRSGPSRSPVSAVVVGVVSLVAATTTLAVLVLRSQYTFSLQSPVRVHFQWPLVVAAKTAGEDALEAQADQFGRRLTAYQQYACNKFRCCAVFLGNAVFQPRLGKSRCKSLSAGDLRLGARTETSPDVWSA